MCGQACPCSASNKNKKLECTLVRIDDDGDDFSVVSLVKNDKKDFFLQFSHGTLDLCLYLVWCWSIHYLTNIFLPLYEKLDANKQDFVCLQTTGNCEAFGNVMTSLLLLLNAQIS